MRAVPAFDEALRLLSLSTDPVADILRTSAYWIPLQFVYVEMIKNRDLIRLSELPVEKKTELWNLVKGFDWPQWKKVTAAQAVYVYRFIKQG